MFFCRFALTPCKWLFYSSVLWLAGCDNTATDPRSNALVYCSEGSPESFNPQQVTSATTMDIISQQLYDRLLNIDADNGDLTPGLATAWQVSEDGTRYTFTLRQSVAFHHTGYFTPSRFFNADDVAFSFRRILEKEHPYHQVNGGSYPFFQSINLAALIKDIHVDAPYQITFQLQHPDSTFLSNLATDFAAILSAEYAEQLTQQKQPSLLDKQPIGTGPFRFKEYQQDVLVRFYRHEQYWGSLAKPAQLVFDIMPNNARRMTKLLTHECDILPYPRVSELAALTKRKDIVLQEKTSMNTGFWAFNTQKPPFDDVRVRQALSMAINKEAIIQAVYSGHATIASSILPPTSWAFTADSSSTRFNPQQAKALLATAGYDKGLAIEIWVMPVQRLYNPNAQKTAELIQFDLANIGVKASIISFEWNTFLRKLRNNDYDSVLIGWTADNADPDNFLTPLLSCSANLSGTNRANWCNPAFDQLLEQGLLQTERQQRQAYYVKAQQMLATEVPLVSIAHANRFQAINHHVQGVSINPYSGIALADAYRQPDKGE